MQLEQYNLILNYVSMLQVTYTYRLKYLQYTWIEDGWNHIKMDSISRPINYLSLSFDTYLHHILRQGVNQGLEYGRRYTTPSLQISQPSFSKWNNDS